LHQQIPFHPPSCTSQEEIVFGYQLYTIPNDRLLCLRWRRRKATRVSVCMALQGSKKNEIAKLMAICPFFSSLPSDKPPVFPLRSYHKATKRVNKIWLKTHINRDVLRLMTGFRSEEQIYVDVVVSRKYVLPERRLPAIPFLNFKHR
jgi:hypothetical protein